MGVIPPPPIPVAPDPSTIPPPPIPGMRASSSTPSPPIESDGPTRRDATPTNHGRKKKRRR
jgi:hypothetical protein